MLSWVLMTMTMLCGWANEAWSRPGTDDAWKGDLLNTKQPGRRCFCLSERTWQRLKNYGYRMIPHVVGWIPCGLPTLALLACIAHARHCPRPSPHFLLLRYSICWVVYFKHFDTQLHDLKKEDEDLYDRIPEFVPVAIRFTFAFFTSFAVVQVRTSRARCACAR